MKKRSVLTKKSSNNAGNVVEGLSHLLADTYLLYLKTQNFHWNVSGLNFPSYHLLFEGQYEALADAIDVLAERIRALKAPTPASFADFLRLTSLKEVRSKLDAKAMLQTLLSDHETIGKNLTNLFTLADQAGDEVTLDLFIQRKTEHDKTAWMLRSTLGQ